MKLIKTILFLFFTFFFQLASFSYSYAVTQVGSCLKNEECHKSSDGIYTDQSKCEDGGGLWYPDDNNCGQPVCYFPVADGSFDHVSWNFGNRREEGARCHAGIDLYTTGSGTIVAAAAGKVIKVENGFATCDSGISNSAIYIQHSGYVYIYGEVNTSTIQVSAGDEVKAGQYLGNATACGMLHLEKRTNSTYERWYPSSGQSVGTAANYCVTHYLETKPSNLLDPTEDIKKLQSNECGNALSGELPVGGDNPDEEEGSNGSSDDDAVIRINNYFITNYSTNQLIEHFTKDGDQAYCAATTTINSQFTNADYPALRLDMEKAFIPLMRNDSYKALRLNSAETYYGVVGGNYTADLYDEDSLLVQSSWLSKVLPAKTNCAMKVLNVIFLDNVYKDCLAAGNTEEYCTSTRHQNIPGSNLTTKDLSEHMEEALVDFAHPTKPESGKIDNVTYCQQLLEPQGEDEDDTDFTTRYKLQQAFLQMPFFANKYYQTGYLVEAVKICPVRPSNGDGSTCLDPAWEYNNCSWEIVPDQIRVYPFKFPMLFNNKNFCDINDPNYPSSCVVNEEFPYHDPTTTYTDPATLNTTFLQTLSQQEFIREATIAARIEMGENAKATPYQSSSELVNCANCGGDNLKQALIKLINTTDKHNEFWQTYLGDKYSDMSCETIGGAESSNSIYSNAGNNVDSGLRDNSVDTFPEYCCKYTLKYHPLTGASCCMEEDFYTIGYDAANGMPIFNSCTESDDDFNYTKAKIRYWIVSPQGDQLKTTEDTVLGSFYPESTYRSLLESDKRQVKRLNFNGLDNAASQISMLGAGPITNIFIVQQSLYVAGENDAFEGNTSAGLFKTLLAYRTINEYFTNNATGGYYTPTTPANEQEIIQAICNKFGAEFGAEVASEAVAIARAESGLNPNSCNRVAFGLFQLHFWYNCYYQLGVSRIPNGQWNCQKSYTDCASRYTVDGNIDVAIAKYKGAGWCPWDVYKAQGSYNGGCTTDSGESWLRVGRGNYNNNKNICVENNGQVVYNPAGDCGQSGKVGVDCSATDVTPYVPGGGNDGDTIVTLIPMEDTIWNKGSFPNRSFTKESSNSFKYWLYKPSNDTSGLPLIIYLHGSGEVGNNLDSLANVSLPKFLKKGNNINAVIIAPQLSNCCWTAKTTEVKQLIDTVVRTYNLDPNKISITGHSLGGQGVYDMINDYPGFFSAGVPISGWGNSSWARNIASTPIQAYHGDKDTSVSYSAGVAIVKAIQQAGGNATMNTIEGAGHIIQDKVYTQTNALQWMISQ